MSNLKDPKKWAQNWRWFPETVPPVIILISRWEFPLTPPSLWAPGSHAAAAASLQRSATSWTQRPPGPPHGGRPGTKGWGMVGVPRFFGVFLLMEAPIFYRDDCYGDHSGKQQNDPFLSNKGYIPCTTGSSSPKFRFFPQYCRIQILLRGTYLVENVAFKWGFSAMKNLDGSTTQNVHRTQQKGVNWQELGCQTPKKHENTTNPNKLDCSQEAPPSKPGSPQQSPPCQCHKATMTRDGITVPSMRMAMQWGWCNGGD